MSIHEYVISKEIATKDFPFYALIMAAMRQADDHNMFMLQTTFPHTGLELKERYNAPGGCLDEHDVQWLKGWEEWIRNEASE
jgi:hypothetical protein